MHNKTPILPLWLWSISGIEDKKSGFGELWVRNDGWRPNIYEKYILISGMAKYLLLISHNIAEPKERRILKEQTLPQSWGSDLTGEGMTADRGWGGSYWPQLVNRQQGSKPQGGNLPPDEMLSAGGPLAGS